MKQIRDKRTRRLWKRAAAILTVMLLLSGIFAYPAAAACRISKTEYEGKGKIEVTFTGRVTYPDLKVSVTDASGKKMKVKIIEKDSDDLEFKIRNYKRGKTYHYRIEGICE